MKSASPNRILLTICVLHAATHLFTTFLQPLNLDLMRFFNLTLDQQITRIPMIYLACYAASNLASGLLVNYFQPRTILAAGPLLNGVCVMSMYFLQPEHYDAMCLLTALGAAGGGLYHPVANILLTQTFPENKGRALGYSGAGACVAFIAAPLLSSYLVHAQICNWQQVCLMYGALGALSGVLALMFVPGGHMAKMDCGLNERGGEVMGRCVEFNPKSEIENQKSNVVLFACFLTVVMGLREMACWGTTAISQQFTVATYSQGIDPGVLLAAIFVPGLIVQPLAGKLSDTLGRERVLALALLGMGASLLLLPLASHETILLPYLLLGASMTATVPTMEALIAERAPAHKRGLVYGVVITAGIALGSLGPLLVGMVADAGQRTALAYRHAFWVLAALGGLSFLLALLLKPVAKILNVEQFGLRGIHMAPQVRTAMTPCQEVL